MDTGGNQVKVATIFIDAGGNGTITFNGSANNYSGVSGFFFVESKLAGDSIANTTPVDPSYYTKTITNTAKLDKNGTDGSDTGTVTPLPTYITKTASTVSPGDSKVNWTVTFNQAGGTLNNVAVTDDLSKVGTLDSVSGVVLDNDTPNQTVLTGFGSQHYTYNNDKLVFHAATVTGMHTLSFSTNFASGYLQQNQGGLSNTAILTANNNSYLQAGVSAKSEVVTGSKNNIIAKDGAGYDASSHTIT